MAVSRVYGLSLKSVFNKEIDFDTDTVKAMLCTSAYVPNVLTHRYKSHVTNELPTAGGYTAGGITLTSKVAELNTGTNTFYLDCADLTWSNATFTCRYLVFYVDTGNAATSSLLSYVDFEADYSPAAQPFTYVIPTTGFYEILVA